MNVTDFVTKVIAASADEDAALVVRVYHELETQADRYANSVVPNFMTALVYETPAGAPSLAELEDQWSAARERYLRVAALIADTPTATTHRSTS